MKLSCKNLKRNKQTIQKTNLKITRRIKKTPTQRILN